jgi:hypothetical protein
MGERQRELAARHAELRLRCALQRRAVDTEVQNIMAPFSVIDRVAKLTRTTLLHPAVLVAGVVAFLALGRGRGLHFVGRAVLLAAAARRLIQAARIF